MMKYRYIHITLEQKKYVPLFFWDPIFLFCKRKIWNALMAHINRNVPLVKFKKSLQLYLINNILVISYSK